MQEMILEYVHNTIRTLYGYDINIHQEDAGIDGTLCMHIVKNIKSMVIYACPQSMTIFAYPNNQAFRNTTFTVDYADPQMFEKITDIMKTFFQ